MFTGWSGDCSGKGTCTLTMDTNHAVTASFRHFCIVPRLKDKTLRRARQSARKAHCSVGKVKPVFSSRVKKGHVVSQKPTAGRRLLGHSRLRLEISKGKLRR
jgi:PASTA domain-containing protein